MATIKQKKAVDKLVEFGRIKGKKLNMGKAMVEAGYSKETAKAPTKLTESKGFKEICKQNGLTENFITKCLQEDIRDKPKNRKGELELASKILGLTNEKLQIGSDGTEIVIRQIMYNNDYKLTKEPNSSDTGAQNAV